MSASVVTSHSIISHLDNIGLILSQINSGAISILARTFVCQQLEASSAVALKAANGVPAEVFAAAVANLTLVNVCGETGDILTRLTIQMY